MNVTYLTCIVVFDTNVPHEFASHYYSPISAIRYENTSPIWFRYPLLRTLLLCIQFFGFMKGGGSKRHGLPKVGIEINFWMISVFISIFFTYLNEYPVRYGYSYSFWIKGWLWIWWQSRIYSYPFLSPVMHFSVFGFLHNPPF